MKKIYYKSIKAYLNDIAESVVEEDKNIFDCFEDFHEDFLQAVTSAKEILDERISEYYNLLDENEEKITNLNHQLNKQMLTLHIYRSLKIIEDMMWDLAIITKENQNYDIYREKFKFHFTKNKLFCILRQELNNSNESDNEDSDSSNNDANFSSEESTSTSSSSNEETGNVNSSSSESESDNRKLAKKIIDIVLDTNDTKSDEETGVRCFKNFENEDNNSESTDDNSSTDEETGEIDFSLLKSKNDNNYSDDSESSDDNSNNIGKVDQNDHYNQDIYEVLNAGELQDYSEI